MGYKHITAVWSLEGLSPTKFLSDLSSEGFEGLYSAIVPIYLDFFGKKSAISAYEKIISHFEPIETEEHENERIIDTGREIIVIDDNGRLLRRYNRVQEPPSIGELFRNKKYPDLLFGLEDDSYEIHNSEGGKNSRIWLSCWSLDERNNTALEEPFNAFLNAVLKASGCDQAIEKILDSDTFSLTHDRMIKELADYNLKQASFDEQKEDFKVISDEQLRQILIEFNKKHNILLSDFSQNNEKASLERKLNYLSGQGLLEKNLIVICRKTGQWWNMTIPSREMLKELEKSGIRCSSCGANITDERIDNLFKISEKGAKLVNGSYWMVGRVVDVLSKLGTRTDNIFADVLYEGDQIDLMAASMANWLAFELKDREFGLGDAYKFHGKVSRLRQKSSDPIVPVIITTKTVAAEARKLLSEVARPNDDYVYKRNVDHRDYIFVEGLENIELELGKWINARKQEKIHQRLKGITARFPARKLSEN